MLPKERQSSKPYFFESMPERRKRGAEMNTFPENSTIVLVHGAWADGSCWNNVILPLQRQRPYGDVRPGPAYVVK
jgi:hypothetical protein